MNRFQSNNAWDSLYASTLGSTWVVHTSTGDFSAIHTEAAPMRLVLAMPHFEYHFVPSVSCRGLHCGDAASTPEKFPRFLQHGHCVLRGSSGTGPDSDGALNCGTAKGILFSNPIQWWLVSSWHCCS